MRNLKKLLALVLAMMMTLSLMITVNAATTQNLDFSKNGEDVTELFREDIIVLTGMGVIQGHDDTKTFNPKDPITRAQMATIIYRMVTGDVNPNRDPYGKGYGNFTDVKGDEWFAGAVGYCANAGLILGYPDGTFKPFKEVTGYEALAMILRAMGYRQEGHNFKGDDWAVTALSTATERGMMKNIIKSTYNNTYRKSANRELVAEMAFQGMTLPQVVWTTALGYQQTGMNGGVLSSNVNPSLGEAFFGLTKNTGVIVGNSATGEADLRDYENGVAVTKPATKIGFSLDSKAVNVWTSNVDITSNPSNIGTIELAQYALKSVIDNRVTNGSGAYVYDSATTTDTVGTYTAAATNAVPANVTLAFQWESNLKQFGHAVDVWYDCRSNETVTVGVKNSGQVSFPTNLKTYAVFDRYNEKATGVVTADSAVLSTDGTAGNAGALGTKVGYFGNAFWNYAFGPTEAANWSTTGAAVPTNAVGSADFTSPIQANNGDADLDGDTSDTHQLYLVVSNNAAGTPDLIVSLNLTISVVSQDNNTTAPLSTGIITENGAGTDYFDLFDQINPTVGDDYSNIANDNLLDSDDIKLRDYVAAVTITGTAPTQNIGGTTSAVEDNNGNATPRDTIGTTGGTSDNSTYYYQMKLVNKKVSGRAIEFNRLNQDVYLQGQTEPLHQSIYALAVDGSFKSNAQVNAPTVVGEYTFYLDEEGNYLFWEQGSTGVEFVYGTYMDYQTQVASGLFSYPFVYVNEKGEQRQREDGITTMTLDGTQKVINDQRYNDELMLPKRTDTAGNSAGFVPGKYIGYAWSGNELTAITDTNMQGTNFVQAGAGDPLGTGVVVNDFNSDNTTIDAAAVNIGAVEVGSSNNLFLTNETKFVVVDGAGTGTQTATVYEGLAALIGANNSSVEIQSATHTATVADQTYLTQAANETNPYEMIYYSMKPFQYSQTYDPSAYAVDTVFIPYQLLNWTANDVPGNLYYLGSNNFSIINDTGTYATRFSFYQNGVENKLWIEGRANTTGGDYANDADIVAELGADIFYRLRDTGAKAHDGEPIYEILAVAPTDPTAGANSIIIGRYYDGTTTVATTSKTAFALGTTGGASKNGDTYLATTYSDQVAYIGGRTNADLWNVGSAGVLNLRPGTYTINSVIPDLNNASSLSNNTGIPVSCVLSEKANTIGYIYVTFSYET